MNYASTLSRLIPGQSSNSSNAATATTSTRNDPQDDFAAFELRPVIRDFKLSAELFASNNEILLIYGKGTGEKQGNLLVSYELPSEPSSTSGGIRLLKILRLMKKVATQLETVPIMKLVLMLVDGIVTLYDIDSLGELATVKTPRVVLFTTWYNPLSSSAPNELKICVATKNRALIFHRWQKNSKTIDDDKEHPSSFDLLDQPRAMGLSNDKICIAYRRSYVIMNLQKGSIMKELEMNTSQEAIITCLQDRTHWCLQTEMNTVFLDSNFAPLYPNPVIWRDFPLAIVHSAPYVLALLNHSVDICTFNGSQSVPVQKIPFRSSSGTNKCRLWMDTSTKRIYVATATDVSLISPISVQTQLKNYVGSYKYELGLVLIRGVLGLSDNSEVGSSRTADGFARGNIERSNLEIVRLFSEQKDPSKQSSIDQSATGKNPTDDSASLWLEYYRVGIMYAFQSFHRSQYDRAFSAFDEFLCDPAEIISLFSCLSPASWLPKPYEEFRAFTKNHKQFNEPNDFVGVRLESALQELKKYLTEVRQTFQKILRASPEILLEVQSLSKNNLILRPVRDLLTIVETSLLKVYLIEGGTVVFINALLRNEQHCCLPTEVEKDLKKYNLANELISFYERQERHAEALQLIEAKKESNIDSILDYLDKLRENNLPLIFKYIEPLLRSALKEPNKHLLTDILNIFTKESTRDTQTIDDPRILNDANFFDPIKIYQFLEQIDKDFAILYLEKIWFKRETIQKQREIHSRLVYSYCDSIKNLTATLQPLITQGHKQQSKEVFLDDDQMASEAGTSNPRREYTPPMSSIKTRLSEYERKLKDFLMDSRCQCDFKILEAYFVQEGKRTKNERLFCLPLAITHGKLGHDEVALKTLASNGLYTDAEQYCDSVYRSDRIEVSKILYRQLIEHYVQKSAEVNYQENSLKPILRIINTMPERLDPVDTLRILPGQLKIKAIQDFLENSIEKCLTRRRKLQLERNLLFLRLTRAQSKRIACENHSFLVNSDTRCARDQCRQAFAATQAVVRFPQDKIVHFHCRTKYENERETRSPNYS